MQVTEVTAADTHALRIAVLRSHMADKDVDYASDHEPGSFHLGVRTLHGDVVAVASFTPAPSPMHPARSAVRLLGMAVAASEQGSGLGRAIVEAAFERLRSDGIAICWANARSSALDFYSSLGFEVVGDEFERVGLPHRLVIAELE